ncbi:MAG: hypothetical protein MJD61_12085 [Proteobacteria bacterium]|nr:hypothetical protein [Pseudomonadota bacterium]
MSSLCVRRYDLLRRTTTLALAASLLIVGASRAVAQPSSGRRIDVKGAVLSILNARNQPIDPARGAVGISHQVANAPTLARDFAYDSHSPDADNLRMQVLDPAARGLRAEAKLQSIDSNGRVRDELMLVLRRPRPGSAFRSKFVRLVADRIDREASGVDRQLLLVGLRDRIRLSYRTHSRTLSHEVRVGRPGHDHGPLAARMVPLRVRILRAGADGRPVVGGSESTGLDIAREQIAIANEIWLQCFVTFGAPELADVQVVDPPPPALLAVSNGNGLPAAGGGLVRFTVAGRPLPAVTSVAGATPTQSALQIARALRLMGFRPRVTVNARTEFGAGPTADIVVRHASNQLAPIAPMAGVALTTDARQSLTIGAVDLSDGLDEFNNMTAASGTLEERTLIKLLADDDPSTIDVLIVNRFSHGTRQGEAFIEASQSSLVNVVLLDRNGLRQQRTAWTLAHELGHVLLNQPFHPDDVGPDRPWLLMDSDNNRGSVAGPKRIPHRECRRALVESGPEALPALMKPYFERAPHPSRQNAKARSE